MAPRLRVSFRKLAPQWLVGSGDGELACYSIGLLLDALLERVRQGMIARYPQHCPEDALAPMGRDRKIVRGIDEPTSAYALRLVRWLDDHKTRGNPWTMLEQLRAYCQADIVVRTVDRRGNWFTIDANGDRSANLNLGNWDWDGGSVFNWSRYWVIIYPTAAGEPWGEIAEDWGDAGLWGGEFGLPGYTFGTTATPEQVAATRQIVREWKPAGTRCEWIITAFDPASFDPDGSPEPDGTWGLWGKYDGAMARTASRLSTARYWKGPS